MFSRFHEARLFQAECPGNVLIVVVVVEVVVVFVLLFFFSLIFVLMNSYLTYTSINMTSRPSSQTKVAALRMRGYLIFDIRDLIFDIAVRCWTFFSVILLQHLMMMMTKMIMMMMMMLV